MDGWIQVKRRLHSRLKRRGKKERSVSPTPQTPFLTGPKLQLPSSFLTSEKKNLNLSKMSEEGEIVDPKIAITAECEEAKECAAYRLKLVCKTLQIGRRWKWTLTTDCFCCIVSMY
jgi:hypothetical protein